MTDPATEPTLDESRPEIGYEQARDELIDVVRKLETGGTTLEESLALWERGEHLAKICEQWLEGARARLQRAVDETTQQSQQPEQPEQSEPGQREQPETDGN